MINVVYLFANSKNVFNSPFVFWSEFNFEKAGNRAVERGTANMEMNVMKLVAAFKFPTAVLVANIARTRFW